MKKEKKILKDYGWCQIHTIDQDYYMSFDAGHFVVGMKTYPISEMQAIEAMDDELTAERIAMEISRDDLQSV